MQVADHIAALRDEGLLLADTAERTGPDAPVGTCPGWRMRDLIRHVGSVHRWAADHVAEQRQTWADLTEADMLRAGPADDALLGGWFREGHQRLVSVLEHADPGMTCATFLPATSPLAFWARRQAHETAIHRVDAELAAGTVAASLGGFPPGLASDGIDELVMGFARRRSKRGLRSDPPCWLSIHARPGADGDGNGVDAGRGGDAGAEDEGGDWIIRMGTGSAEVARGTVRDGSPEGSGCTLTGPPGALYLAVWNRAGTDGLELRGDPRALDVWRTQVSVIWS